MSTVKAIYAGLRALGLAEEDDRRDLYARVTGKRRLREMTPAEKEAVLEELRRTGFRGAAAAGRAGGRRLAGPYAPKLQALWIAGWNLALVRDRTDGALLSFVRRQSGIDHTRFLTEQADANRAIEGLKAWLARDGGVDWRPRRGRPAWEGAPGARVFAAQVSRACLAGLMRPDAMLADGLAAALGRRADPAALDARGWQAAMNALGARLRAAAAGARAA